MTRHCPYCAAVDLAEAFWVDEDREWLEARVRELLVELRRRRLHMQPTGGSKPPSPGVGRGGGADLTIPLPCCGEEMTVSAAWNGAVCCHFCGFVHARRAVRDIGLELALLRGWIA